MVKTFSGLLKLIGMALHHRDLTVKKSSEADV